MVNYNYAAIFIENYDKRKINVEKCIKKEGG